MVNEYSLFTYPDYTLPLAVKMAQVAREARARYFSCALRGAARDRGLSRGPDAGRRGGCMRRRSSPLCTGTDTTLLGQDPSYRPAIEHALSHSDAITTVSESLRQETVATFQLERPVEVIRNFFVPSGRLRSREEIRRELRPNE